MDSFPLAVGTFTGKDEDLRPPFKLEVKLEISGIVTGLRFLLMVQSQGLHQSRGPLETGSWLFVSSSPMFGSKLGYLLVSASL